MSDKEEPPKITPGWEDDGGREGRARPGTGCAVSLSSQPLAHHRSALPRPRRLMAEGVTRPQRKNSERVKRC